MYSYSFINIGFSIFASLWHKHIYGLNHNIPKYCNPYILIVYISAVLFTIFVLATFINQTINISTGYTLKHSNSIRSQKIDLTYFHKEMDKEYKK